MVHQEEGIYRESSRDEKGKMHSPPKRTAKDLLLHMADEANTIIEIEVCKSRARSASLLKWLPNRDRTVPGLAIKHRMSRVG